MPKPAPGFSQQIVRRLYRSGAGTKADKNNNSSKSLPDLSIAQDLLLEELKSVTLQRHPAAVPSEATKSFSSRFVSHVKQHPDGSSSVKVVRRKKSGLVDDHFEATVPSCKEQAKSSPPPCNCPRHATPEESRTVANGQRRLLHRGGAILGNNRFKLSTELEQQKSLNSR